MVHQVNGMMLTCSGYIYMCKFGQNISLFEDAKHIELYYEYVNTKFCCVGVNILSYLWLAEYRKALNFSVIGRKINSCWLGNLTKRLTK